MKDYTKTQAKLVYLLTKRGMTLKQAATVLKRHPRTVEKMYQRIRRKDLWTYPAQKSENSRGGFPPYHPAHFRVRLHNVQWHITPSYIEERYHHRRVKSQSFRMGDLTFVLQARSFEIYSSQDFWGEDADDCLKKALDYFFAYFEKVERELGVVFIKDKSSGAKMVRSHYAEVGNELAQDVKAKKGFFKLEGQDGKAWLEVDASKGTPELETTHAAWSREDMNKVKPFFDDLRAQEQVVTLTQILASMNEQTKIVSEIAKVNLQTASGLQAVVSALRALLPVQGTMKEEAGVVERPAYVG